MATLLSLPNGRKRIQFTIPSGPRKSIRLGKISDTTAKTIKDHIEHLLWAQKKGHPIERKTREWLAELNGKLRQDLVHAGLVASDKLLLKDFLDSYIEKRTDVKDSTREAYLKTRRNLIEFFGEDKVITTINAGEADEWRWHLMEKLAQNTVRRRSGLAKQFFDAAVKKKILTENPFDDLETTVKGNSARDRFITRAEAAAILEACPDHQWLLIFAFSRFGGLRTPSEGRRGFRAADDPGSQPEDGAARGA
jgi:integrase